MKMKKILMLTACFLFLGQVAANNVLTVSDVNVPQGGQATIEIGCDFDTEFTAFEMQLSLPEGLSLLCDEDGKPVTERAFDGSHVISGNKLPSNGNYKFTCYSTNENSLLLPITGALLRLTVVADASLSMGSCLNAFITATEFTRLADSKGENLDDVEFTIHITEYRTILDENALTIPESEENANVRVLRTINANEWSTICLPFAMSETLVKATFGDDVQLGDFVDYDFTEDGDGNIISISVNLADATAIEANHPYTIKVSHDITEFTVEGVDIEPDEESAYTEYNNGLTGKRKVIYGTFEGTLHAGKTLAENQLFLSDNQFWYSSGLTTIKAFRAYFDFEDVLSDVENASSRVVMKWNDEHPTGISEIKQGVGNHSQYYDLSGRRIVHPHKGVYIVDGKKTVIK